MEVTQFTYFQQVGGIDCKPVTGEITYGPRRLAMYIRGAKSLFELEWTPGVTYRDLCSRRNEVERGTYGKEHSRRRLSAAGLRRVREDVPAPDGAPAGAARLRAAAPRPAAFNLLDARGAISVTGGCARLHRPHPQPAARAVGENLPREPRAPQLRRARQMNGPTRSCPDRRRSELLSTPELPASDARAAAGRREVTTSGLAPVATYGTLSIPAESAPRASNNGPQPVAHSVINGPRIPIGIPMTSDRSAKSTFPFPCNPTRDPSVRATIGVSC